MVEDLEFTLRLRHVNPRCRMNAYKLKLSDNTVDVVVENAMLHLVDNPLAVIKEITRAKARGAIVRYGSLSLQGNPIRYEVNNFCDNALKDMIVVFLIKTEYTKSRKVRKSEILKRC